MASIDRNLNIPITTFPPQSAIQQQAAKIVNGHKISEESGKFEVIHELQTKIASATSQIIKAERSQVRATHLHKSTFSKVEGMVNRNNARSIAKLNFKATKLSKEVATLQTEMSAVYKKMVASQKENQHTN